MMLERQSRHPVNNLLDSKSKDIKQLFFRISVIVCGDIIYNILIFTALFVELIGFILHNVYKFYLFCENNYSFAFKFFLKSSWKYSKKVTSYHTYLKHKVLKEEKC